METKLPKCFCVVCVVWIMIVRTDSDGAVVSLVIYLSLISITTIPAELVVVTNSPRAYIVNNFFRPYVSYSHYWLLLCSNTSTCHNNMSKTKYQERFSSSSKLSPLKDQRCHDWVIELIQLNCNLNCCIALSSSEPNPTANIKGFYRKKLIKTNLKGVSVKLSSFALFLFSSPLDKSTVSALNFW